MKTELKPNIFIEGFDSESEFRRRMYGRKGISFSVDLIYQGKTSDVPEEIAEKYTGKHLDSFWKDYSEPIHNIDYLWVETAKESIESACKQEWCVIYKTK